MIIHCDPYRYALAPLSPFRPFVIRFDQTQRDPFKNQPPTTLGGQAVRMLGGLGCLNAGP